MKRSLLVLIALLLGCAKEADKKLLELCYEWTGRTLGSEVLQSDKLIPGSVGIEKDLTSYDIIISDQFKGHGGNPYIWARNKKIIEVTAYTFDLKNMPTIEDLKHDSVVVDFTRRLGVEPTFTRESKMGVEEVGAHFKLGEQTRVEVSFLKCGHGPESVRQKYVTFRDDRK